MHITSALHSSWGKKVLPMFIAGGTAYCRWRMNWYSGSGWMRPSRTAPFTSAVPSSGSRMYLTATTPAITDGGTLAPLRTPVVVNQRVSRVMHACGSCMHTVACDQSKLKQGYLPFRRFAPMINVTDGIAPPLYSA